MEPNPQFAINTILPPCRVTKSLLVDLQKNISATLLDIARSDARHAEQSKVSITDEHGEEAFFSAEQMTGNQFPDSTNEVCLELSLSAEGTDQYPATVLKVSLRFRPKHRPALRILLQCPRARDQAKGLEDRIRRIMDENFDDSVFFRPNKSVRESLALFVAFGSIFWLLFAGGSLFERKYSDLTTSTFFFWSLLFAVMWAYLIVCIRYFPQCSFDTKRRAALDGQKDWAKRAVWTLIFVNFLLVAVGQMVVARARSFFGF